MKYASITHAAGLCFLETLDGDLVEFSGDVEDVELVPMEEVLAYRAVKDQGIGE